MSDAAIIQLIGLAGLFITTVAKIYFDARNRQWDIADRQAKDEAAKKERAAATASVKEAVRQQGTETNVLIADNTSLAQASAEQLGIVQGRQDTMHGSQENMRGVVEQTALDTLHHTAQPVFDDLIDKYKADTLTDQELTQFIERVRVIASDPTDTTAQLPAAKMMLQSAEERQKMRNSEKIAPASEHKENVAAGEQMRKEAEPQQGQSVDDGEGPQGTIKKVAALSDKIDKLDQTSKVETLKKTVDRIDKTTTDIKSSMDNGKE